MGHVIGIDIGTSTVKAAVIESETLEVLATADQEYPILQPKPGYAEQNPEDWWQATIQTVREALAQVDSVNVVGIGLSGQMHGFTCLNKKGDLLRPAIIWADTRSKEQVEYLNQKEYAHIAPGPPAVGFMASTLMWMQKYERETIQQLGSVILPKDYVRYRLTGTISTDPTDAVATWLFDVRKSEWSDELLQLCRLDKHYLPPITSSSEVVGHLTKYAAQQLGLPTTIPVVSGSADMTAQALGYGLTESNTALVIVGTGGQVFRSLTQPLVDSKMRYYTFIHAVPDRWYAQAAILSAGLSLRWLRDMLGLRETIDAYKHLSERAGNASVGADGLLFLPYLAGERTPLMDANATGMFLGLRLHHTPGHLARAVIEGVAFALHQCLALIGEDVGEVILSGGATKSPVWRQIFADVIGKPLALAVDMPYACIGAGILAGVGTGIYKNIDDGCARLPSERQVVSPNLENRQIYLEYAEMFRQLYPLLRTQMHWLSGL